MRVYKGKILTVNKNNDVFDYLVEDNGYIEYVGNKLPEQYENAEVINLGKSVLVPSCVDTCLLYTSCYWDYTGVAAGF